MNNEIFTLSEILGGKQKAPEEPQQLQNAFFSTPHARHLFHRVMSERKLEELLPSEVHPGDCLHVISAGDVDSLSYLMWLNRKTRITKLLCSTWCIASTDISELERQHDLGNIGTIDFYVGEILPGSYPAEYKEICKLCLKTGGRAAVFRNHSKVMAAIGDKFSFAIESSANINTNPRTENTVITISAELAAFYFEYFDKIISFDREWKKNII